MPYERMFVDYSDESKDLGLTGNESKDIIVILGDKIRTYAYSKSVLNSYQKKMGVPYKDLSEGVQDLPIYHHDNPYKLNLR